MLDYQVDLSTVYYDDCTSQYGQIRENVGLLKYWIIKESLLLKQWKLVIKKSLTVNFRM